MLLLAVKGLHVQPDAELGEEQVRMKDYLLNDQTLIGCFNKNGDFYISEDEIELAE